MKFKELANPAKRKELMIGCLTETAIAVAAFGAGAYHGYCDEKKIPFAKESMAYFLTYGPTILTGGIGAIEGLAKGFIRGGAEGVASTIKEGLVEEAIKKSEKSEDGVEGVISNIHSGIEKRSLESFAKGLAGAAVGSVSHAVIRGTIRGAEGAVATVLGYALGKYLVVTNIL